MYGHDEAEPDQQKEGENTQYRPLASLCVRKVHTSLLTSPA